MGNLIGISLFIFGLLLFVVIPVIMSFKSVKEQHDANPLNFCSATPSIEKKPHNKHYHYATSTIDFEHLTFLDEFNRPINVKDYTIMIAGDNFHPSYTIKEAYLLFINKKMDCKRRMKDEKPFYVGVIPEPENTHFCQIRCCRKILNIDFSDIKSAQETITEAVKKISADSESFKKIKVLPGFNYMDMMMDLSIEFERFCRHLEDMDELRTINVCLTTGCSNDENVFKWFLYSADEVIGDVEHIFSLRKD